MRMLLSRCLALAMFAFALPTFALAAQVENEQPLRIIIFGAHPDDGEYKVGGTAAKWAKLGHKVKIVSVTNGDIGHWEMSGGALAQRRKAEVEKADAILGAECEVLDIHDGELVPSLENRQKILRLIRDWQADVVISHRPWDYHPDHRAVGLLVQDAAFMVTVPFMSSDVPHLKKNPLFLFTSDGFTRPYPFQVDIAVSVDDVFDQKIDAIHELTSQAYEGGAAGSEAHSANVPPATFEAGRKAWLREQWERKQSSEARKGRNALQKWYGAERGDAVKLAEIFEICEYGRRPSDDEIRRLFPFFD